MNYSATLCRVVLSTLITIVISGLASAGVHDDYKTPLFTIPYAATPPTIDGSIDDAQWQNALSINALQTTEGNISSRQARVWMMWDADNLYLAMRSPLRPGEKVLQATRDPGRDNVKTVFDDAYEIFLNFGTRSPNGEIVFFQYLGNVAGAKYDVMFEPTVGNSRPGWESGWKPKNRITPDGKFWEMTVAIPRQSVYMNTPFADGMQIQGLFVRDFKRPWEQNSIGGSGSFSVPETHCKFILSKSAPVIQLLDVADVKNQTFGANVTILPRVTERIKFSVTSDNGGKTTSDEIQVAGQRVWLENRLNLGLPGKGYYRITIKNEDESKTYLDWCSKLAFGDLSATTQPIHDTDDKADLSLSFNPVKNYVRVEGDFINYANRGSIARYAAQVLDSNGKQLAQKDLTLDNLAYVHGLMQLGDCPPGSYTARLTCYDAGGKQVLAKETSFEKKDAAKEYPWWNTTAGNIEKVLDPWTPMKDEGGKIDVWGRTMTVGAAGLPSQVTTQGSEILASPMSLVAETAAGSVAATSESIKTTEQSDHRIITQTTAKLGDLSVATKTTAEFDGMYKVQMTITPQKSTSVKSLKVVIPINPAFAEYTNACGEGIRYGFSYGYLPKDKTGPLWSSKQVDGQPMLVGSFIPYVWIGNEHGGLCWFANSDEGWMPNDNVPGIEIRRDSPASVNLVLNLISSDSTIDAPRNITFAFQATPVKPIRAGWRMDTWSTADSFKDFCCVEPKGGHLIWNALPFTLDNAGCIKKVEERHKMDNNYNFGIIKNYHANAVPYFENNGIDKNFAPEVAYFGDQWRARVSDSSAYDKTLQDFIVYNLGKWARECNIDGWYVDNVRPVADDNIDAGRGLQAAGWPHSTQLPDVRHARIFPACASHVCRERQERQVRAAHDQSHDDAMGRCG